MALDTGLDLWTAHTATIAAAATPRLSTSEQDGTAVELVGGAIPLDGAQLVALVPVADADASLEIHCQVSTDNGATYRSIGVVTIPATMKGVFVAHVGKVFRPYRYAAASVQVRCAILNLSNAQWGAAVIYVYLASGEADLSGMTPAGVLQA